MKKILRQPNRGFGLIEILVSVAIFSIIAVVGITSLLTLIDAGEKSQSLNSVMQNLNVALETMARNVRTGTHYSCSEDVGISVETMDGAGCVNNGNTVLQFVPAASANTDARTKYFLSNGQIFVLGPDDSDPIPVSAKEVIIDDLKFRVINSGSDTKQARVLMNITGHVQTREKNNVTFTLQTTMTQRLIEDFQEI